MKKTISPLLKLGIIVSVIHTLTINFITPIPDFLSLTILMVAVALIIVGGIKSKYKDKAD
ncbi:hypothetical protein GC105_02630 [Alkalibaculum sp. M08DMB]|uniref:Uncharacterized protein n=1 Tax=Alkalibaculum sporogenes TaxID=2655001 RepID=A0A6A7K5L7_9FIRM|nr:hypothetical protein [Alkalibaculum sporogenes]MPW24690.1 hypothetical protein [Alkalibaculum sporogenes]